MLPRGMGRRDMERLLRTMKISIEEMSDIQQVILKSPTRELIIENPVVNAFDIRGEKVFQITGKLVETSSLAIPEEDVQLVVQQTGASFEAAKKALEQTSGDLAAAILMLKK